MRSNQNMTMCTFVELGHEWPFVRRLSRRGNKAEPSWLLLYSSYPKQTVEYIVQLSVIWDALPHQMTSPYRYTCIFHIGGLVQDYSNSIANTMELLALNHDINMDRQIDR